MEVAVVKREFEDANPVWVLSGVAVPAPIVMQDVMPMHRKIRQVEKEEWT